LNYSNYTLFPRLRWEKEVRLVGEQPTNSTDDHGIASVMPAWTAGIQVRRDASGDIHVNLGSGTPCRNDDIEEYSLKLTKLSVANSRTPKNRRVTLRAMTNMLVLAFG
jgi:hypothetical protein